MLDMGERLNLKGMAKMKQAKSRLILSNVFFGTAAMSLQFKVDNNIKTAETDGRYLWFNEKYINALPLRQCESVIAHEAVHCILLHPMREGAREHKRFNKACDYVGNGIVQRSGLPINERWLLHNKYSDGSMNAEMVYTLLPPGKDGDDGGDDWNVGGVRKPKNDDGSEMSESEASQLEQNWKVTAVNAANQARKCGQLPADLDRMIQEIIVKKRDLEDIIREFVQKAIGDGDYNWRHPNKKHIVRDLYMPSVRSEYVPDIVFAIDTSTSVSQKQLDYFAAKASNVLSEYVTTAHVIYCDTVAHYDRAYEQCDLPLKLKAKGGGGTDFIPPFVMVDEMGIEPVCLFYLTDLECSSFPDDPGYPVMWSLYSTWGDKDRFKVPFGEVIDINPDNE